MSSRLNERFATGSKLPASRTIPSIFRRRSRSYQTNHTPPSLPQPPSPSSNEITDFMAQRASKCLYAPWRTRSNPLRPSNTIRKQSTRAQRAKFLNAVVSRLRHTQLNRISTSTTENRLSLTHAQGAPYSSTKRRLVRNAKEGSVAEEDLHRQV